MKRLALIATVLVSLVLPGMADAKSHNPLPWKGVQDAANTVVWAPWADQTTELNDYDPVGSDGPYRCKARSSRSWGCTFRVDFQAADDVDYRTPPAPIESCYVRAWLWQDGSYMFPASGWGCNPNWRL